ncbi:aminotransferase class V-fold PLP-dependent enzyme [Alteriqipengyuania sp. WL0013]|nr:aminotransferase class V-fold PLP-dependent enzyme [Alteriqipengyuania sp. WL0013]MEB3415462.1 aminotransferase class V-fold PLP-dependent enzyme [Alteriqipengyuania sp. WL0013]
MYLDHAASSPLRPEARAAMEEGFAVWANPSSPHAEGRKARAALEDARARIKAALGWEGEVILTSGASEAAALALGKAKGGARIVSSVEHDAVRDAAPIAEQVPVRPDGRIDMDALQEALEREAPVVAIQQVNSETGVVQEMAAIAGMVRDAGGRLLADCSQGAAKMPLPPCDMAIVSAHKFGGPIGVGALLVRDFALLEPTGGQERGYRRGTENLPGALGMAVALEAAKRPYLDPAILAPLGELKERVVAAGLPWIPDMLAETSPYILPLAMPGMSASAQVMRFDMAGIALSQGSACSSGTLKTSRVFEAMGFDPDIAERIIRVSFGWSTTRADVERFCETWCELAGVGA